MTMKATKMKTISIIRMMTIKMKTSKTMLLVRPTVLALLLSFSLFQPFTNCAPTLKCLPMGVVALLIYAAFIASGMLKAQA